jgi:hypothetical protein
VWFVSVFRFVLKLRPWDDDDVCSRMDCILAMAARRGRLREITDRWRMEPTWEQPMTRQGMLARCTLLLGTLGLLASSSGCQTTIGGQTLPSAYYLKDDIQFFPAGDEFLLPETVKAMDEYRAQQAGFVNDLGDVGAAGPNF